MTGAAEQPLDPNADLAQILAEAAPAFGLSRPAGLCFGAIWRAAQAPSAEDLTARLGLSRSNVSVALKDLRAAGLIRAARAPGSRKDYFVADADPWAIARALLAERHRRALAPLRDRLAELSAAGDDPRAAPLGAMLTEASNWMAALARLSPEDLARAIATPSDGKKKKKKHDRE